MIIPPEIIDNAESLKKRVKQLNVFASVDDKLKEIESLEQSMTDEKFWENSENATPVYKKIRSLKNIIEPIVSLQKKIENHAGLIDMLKSEDEDISLLEDLQVESDALAKSLDSLEMLSFLSQKHDECNAILSVHAGAGGTESCDWADMLLRMYLRWMERRGFKYEIQDIQQGDEAGISRATVRVAGENAYGHVKAERGVHRLVRISPFDSNSRRHTSFCSVDVVAEIEDDCEIEINGDDLRIDTYRSSGKGGQHVNKTESAIRITHIPTGIVVTCQSDRSQHKNKDFAMKSLRSRLYERMEDEKRNEMDKFYGKKGEISWGNQIRSYVFQPYQMVKDLRTGTSTSDVQGVMDGDIDSFINAWLRAGCPSSRNSNLSGDD